MSGNPQTLTFQEAAQAHVEEQSERAPVQEHEEAPQADLQEADSVVEEPQQAAGEAELSEDLEEDHPDEGQELSGEEDGEPVDEVDGDEGEEEELTVTIHEDGRELEVTLSELRRGYIRERTFTKKTTDLAAQRKAMEAQSEQVSQLEQTNLAALQEIVTGLAGQPVPQPDPQLFYTDREAYQEAEMRHNKWASDYNQWNTALQQTAAQVNERKKQEFQARIQEEFPKILKKWNLPEAQAQEAVSRINDLQASSAEAYGLPQRFFAEALDHGLYLALEDAKKWRDLQAGGNKKAMSKLRRKGIKPVRSGRANVNPKKVSQGDMANKRFEQTADRYQTGQANKADLFAEAALAHQAEYRK